MELALNNRFCEMTVEELDLTDGGRFSVPVVLPIGGIVLGRKLVGWVMDKIIS